MRAARWLVCGALLCEWGWSGDGATAVEPIHQSVLVERTVFGRALRGNQFGEPLNRNILIYLPPGYHAPANRHRRYPVVYLLAGVGGDHRNFAADGTPNRIAAGRPQMIDLGLDMQQTADQLIASHVIDEAILVGVSGMNTLSNHWFACSEVIGDYRGLMSQSTSSTTSIGTSVRGGIATTVPSLVTPAALSVRSRWQSSIRTSLEPWVSSARQETISPPRCLRALSRA